MGRLHDSFHHRKDEALFVRTATQRRALAQLPRLNFHGGAAHLLRARAPMASSDIQNSADPAGASLGAAPSAPFAHRWRWAVLIGFTLCFSAAIVYGRGAASALVAGGFDDPSSESSRADLLLESRLGLGTPHVVVVHQHSDWKVADPRFMALLAPAIERIRRTPGVQAVSSPYGATPDSLVSKDGKGVVTTVRLAGSGIALQGSFDAVAPLLQVPGLTTLVGGALPGAREAEEAAERDLVRAELITLPLLAILLVVFFRGVVVACIPLLIGGFSVAAALACLRLLSHVTDVSVFAMNIVTFVGLGVAVDYSLFMTTRFRDELHAGSSVEVALATTLHTAGRTVAYSGLAVAVSLLALLVFPLMLLKSVAIAGSVVVLMALLGSLVALPAMLAALGPRISWLSLPQRDPLRPPRAWRVIAATVMRAPLLVTVLVTALLLVMGAPFLDMKPSISGASVLPEDAQARQVAALVESERFSRAKAPAVRILVTSQGEVLTPSGLSAIERYAHEVARVDHVKRVDALVGGTTSPSSAQLLQQLRGPNAPAVRAQLSRATLERDTALGVALDVPPASPEAVAAVKAIRAIRVPTLSAVSTGQAAHLMDMQSALSARLPWAIAIICAATFLVLFLAFGSVIMPIKAILMNILSLTASFGALVWVFQDGRFEWLLDYRATGDIELTIPVIMFAVMFGLAMDYELFLLSRIREAYDATGDTHESVSRGLEQTGRIITQAALLLVGVTVGFISADMLIVKEIGVGMAVAIIVDATIVRLFLVPATMQLLGGMNWWSPPSIARLWARFSFGVDESSPSQGAHAKSAPHVLPGP